MSHVLVTSVGEEASSLGRLTILQARMNPDLARRGRASSRSRAVVDVDRGIMAIDAGMHADEEAMLIQDGSDQRHLWGINLYPAEHGTEGWLEFDSMINLRPGQGNRTRSVDDPTTRSRIARIVDRLVAIP